MAEESKKVLQARLEAKRKADAEASSLLRKKNNMLIRNQLLIEDGLINFNYNNSFNIRVANHRKYGPGAVGSIETYIREMQLAKTVESHHDNIKEE